MIGNPQKKQTSRKKLLSPRRKNASSSSSNRNKVKIKGIEKSYKPRLSGETFPWTIAELNVTQSEALDKQVHMLSHDKTSFIEFPKETDENKHILENFEFDWAGQWFEESSKCCDNDERLAQLWDDLVPHEVNDETFWRNFAANVLLVQTAFLQTCRPDLIPPQKPKRPDNSFSNE